MIRVYIAGAISNENPLVFLDNIGRGIRMGNLLIQEGFAPFNPMLDFQYRIEDPRITREQYHQISASWLLVAEAVLVLPGSEESKGVEAEIAIAEHAGIPVFYSLMELKKALTPAQ